MTVIKGGGGSTPEPSLLNQVRFGRPLGVLLKDFGVLFGLIGFAVCAWTLLKHYPRQTSLIWFGAGSAFALAAYAAPVLLYPLWRAWMALAVVLERIMSSVILSIMWTAVMVPIALLLRVIGKRVMDLSWRAEVTTYWEERKAGADDFRLLERQF